MTTHLPARGLVSVVFAFALCLVSPVARPQPKPSISVDLGGAVTLDLVLVVKGKYEEGSPANEPGRGDDETPRAVTLTRDFYLGKFPVTRGQFARFTSETGYRTEAERGTSGGSGWDGSALVQKKEFNWKNPGFAQTDDHPVSLVTFDDAQAFAAWAAKKAGRAVTLPTEAQWEYACRAGTKSRYCGAETDAELPSAAWFKTNAGNGTRPVGQKKPNTWGLHDMSGNLYEWCRDWYGPYEPGPATDPEETRQDRSDKPRRVLRGGSWLKDAKGTRAAARYRNTPGSRNADNGFRVLASVEAGSAAVPTPAPAPAPPPGGGGGPPPDVVPWLIGGGIVVFLGLGFVGVVFALIVFLIIRGARRTGAGSVTTRVQADGFWIDAPRTAPGSTVRYRCRVRGSVTRGAARLDAGPRGQFVYTGSLPSEIVIEGVDAPARGGWPGPPARSSTWRDDNDDRFGAQPFRGHPSAYR